MSNLSVALTKAGINPDLYAGHSFRTATVVHITGIEDPMIMTLGRWKSNAYQRYVEVLLHYKMAKLSPTGAGLANIKLHSLIIAFVSF